MKGTRWLFPLALLGLLLAGSTEHLLLMLLLVVMAIICISRIPPDKWM
jgi:hypothetical protein